MKRLQCLVASTIMVGLGPPVHATVRHVPSQYLTIQAAIDACVDGDTVVVANNTYSGLGNVNLDFKGLDIVVRSSGGAANCIIDCQNAANTRGFTFDSGEPSTAILAGFTIRNGNVTNPSGTGYGGGIFVNSGQPIIYQCIIEDCDANSGGGIAVHTGGGVMAHCIVRRNTATAIGTGPDVYGGGLEIRTPYKVMYSTVRDNIASVPVSGSNGAYGGGVAVGVSGIVTLRGTTIRDNQASGRSITTCYGGGMYVQQFASSSQTRIEDCLLIGNRASSPLGSPGGTGGALMARSDVSIMRSRFEGNAADFSGGAVFADIGWMNIDASIIRGNTAKWGGGIHTGTFSTFSIANSLITDNIAQAGGGAALTDGDLVSSCTITRNYASNGGGLHILGLSCSVENSIVWGNVGSSGAQIEVQTSFPAACPSDTRTWARRRATSRALQRCWPDACQPIPYLSARWALTVSPARPTTTSV